MRFTIRDVLWLTAVVGLGLALFLKNLRVGELKSYIVDLEIINGQYKAAVDRAGYSVYFSGDGPYLIKTPIIRPETEEGGDTATAPY